MLPAAFLRFTKVLIWRIYTHTHTHTASTRTRAQPRAVQMGPKKVVGAIVSSLLSAVPGAMGALDAELVQEATKAYNDMFEASTAPARGSAPTRTRRCAASCAAHASPPFLKTTAGSTRMQLKCKTCSTRCATRLFVLGISARGGHSRHPTLHTHMRARACGGLVRTR